MPEPEIRLPTKLLDVAPWAVTSRVSFVVSKVQAVVETTASVVPEAFLKLTEPSSHEKMPWFKKNFTYTTILPWNCDFHSYFFFLVDFLVLFFFFPLRREFT